MKYLKYILIVFILILTPCVYASEYNLNSHTSATKNGTTNRYSCLETYLYGSNNTCTFGTRYNGRMGQYESYINYPFEGNTNYVFTLNMATEDWRNNFKSAWIYDCEHDSISTVYSVNYVSYKKIKINYTPNENTTCAHLLIRSKNYPSDAFTGVNNWNLSSITLYDPDYQSGSGGGQGTATPSPSPTNDYSSIINNQNENTEDIINNQNDNTQDIIDNANENTDKITDAINTGLNSCYDSKNLFNFPRISTEINNGLFWSVENGVITINGTASSSGRLIVVPLVQDISLNSNQIYSVSINKSGSVSNAPDIQLRSTSANINSTSSLYYPITLTNNNSTISIFALYIASGTTFNNYQLKPQIEVGSTPTAFGEFGSQVCSSKLDETNAFLTDNSDPFISDNEFTSLLDSVNINNPLSSLLQLPVQFINAIVNQSNSCQVVNLGTLLGVPITLPCINLGSILGSTVWNIIDVLSSIGLIVLILKQLYESITNALTLGGYMEAKKGGLGYMPPLEFLCDIITGFGGDKI